MFCLQSSQVCKLFRRSWAMGLGSLIIKTATAIHTQIPDRSASATYAAWGCGQRLELPCIEVLSWFWLVGFPVSQFLWVGFTLGLVTGIRS